MTVNVRAQQEVTFKAVRFFDGMKSNGVRFAINLYESSDGVGVSQTVEIHPSATRALGELKRRIRRATKILERKTERDENGRLTGEKVTVLLPKTRDSEAHAAVLGTAGRELYIIESRSLRHVVIFASSPSERTRR